MRRIIVCMILVLFTGAISSAQGIRLSGYGGYVFDDKMDSYYDATHYYDGKIKGGFQWGVGVEYLLVPAYGIELLYLRQDTKLPMDYYSSGVKHTDFDLGVNYIMVGGNRYLNPDMKITPYAGALLGVAIFNLKNPDSGNEGTHTFFAWGLKAGGIFNANSSMSIKIQAHLLSAVQSVGAGYYFGGGAVLTSYSTIYQFGFSGGLTFQLWSGTSKSTKRKN